MSPSALLLTILLTTQKLPYDTEYPEIRYSSATPTDAIAELQQRIEGGSVDLAFDEKSGYLASLLDVLEIPIDSQTLVFSKTSFQVGLISPQAPRALYFKDDVYVAFVQKSPSLEVSTVDPNLGAVFYTLSQEKSARPRFERETFLCLRCHDSYSLTGGGVPRHIIGSGIPDRRGRQAYHEGWQLTTDGTPLEKRWGGWYVTGTHGDQVHMGNLVLEDPATLDLKAGANVTDLGEKIDTGPYLGKHSDIVALMVLEHQIHVQNRITRVSWEARSKSIDEIEDHVDALVRAMLFLGEAQLTSPIAGTSDFAAEFVRRGPEDGRGRSLRELDLKERLFRYRCSYLIYSDAFDALPNAVKALVYERLRSALEGRDASGELDHLPPPERRAILEILEETKADFPK